MDQFSGGRSAALMLQRFPTMTPEALKTLILNLAERGALTGIGASSPNRLLHWDPLDIGNDGFETGDTRFWIEF